MSNHRSAAITLAELTAQYLIAPPGAPDAMVTDVAIHSQYVTMRDGVRLAVDIVLPKPLPPTVRLPAILTMTRYWRATDLRSPFSWWINPAPLAVYRLFARHGYVLIFVDVRGTGASFGVNRGPLAPEEIADLGEVATWVAAQPWCNGRIGAYGTSYAGSTAELIAATGAPALRAVFPRFNEFDIYTDIAFPGGVPLEAFIRHWGETNAALDANRTPANATWWQRALVRGVKPVDADRDRALLAAAVREHAANVEAHTLVAGYTYRDDIGQGIDRTLDVSSPFHHRAAIEAAGVPLAGWGGWCDAATADAVIRRFLTFTNPQLAVIGPWNHGASHVCSPYAAPGKPVEPAIPDQYRAVAHFFDNFLVNDVTGGFTTPRVLLYFTMGEERWKATTVWPPAGTTVQRWYFQAGSTLALTAPLDATGADSYTADFSTTTGVANRWHTQLDQRRVDYGDRAAADRRLLTYTSAPLSAELEITGHPVVTLQVTSTAGDGAFFVYLEEVDETGVVRMLTEGMLRALHRKVSTAPPPYAMPVPYHSFRRCDGAPLTPGEVTELSFGLLPLSVRVARGRRLRVAIACADADTFAPIAQYEQPVLAVQRNQVWNSWIDLPIMML